MVNLKKNEEEGEENIVVPVVLSYYCYKKTQILSVEFNCGGNVSELLKMMAVVLVESEFNGFDLKSGKYKEAGKNENDA